MKGNDDNVMSNKVGDSYLIIVQKSKTGGWKYKVGDSYMYYWLDCNKPVELERGYYNNNHHNECLSTYESLVGWWKGQGQP